MFAVCYLMVVVFDWECVVHVVLFNSVCMMCIIYRVVCIVYYIVCDVCCVIFIIYYIMRAL